MISLSISLRAVETLCYGIFSAQSLSFTIGIPPIVQSLHVSLMGFTQAPACGLPSISLRAVEILRCGDFLAWSLSSTVWIFPTVQSLHVLLMGFPYLGDGNAGTTCFLSISLQAVRTFCCVISPTQSPFSTDGISHLESNQSSPLC